MSSIISFYPNIRQTKNGKDMPVDVFLQYIQDGKWQDDVLAVRTNRKTKDQLPYVTLSGKFNERKISGLIRHSGYLCMDIDDVDDPEMLKSILGPDKYVYAAFVSVSGKGLAVMFRINPDKHLEAFEGLQEYLFTNYEIITDPSCKDVSRPRYVSYDPHMWLNQHAEKFTQYPKKQKALTKIPEVVYVQSDFDSIVQAVVERRVDITGDYHQWLRIGFALADKFGEGGRGYFHQVSQFHPQYSPHICDKQYTNCLKAHGQAKATIATFYYYAKQAGIQITSDRTRLITTTAALAKKGRRTKEDTIKLLEDAEGITGAEDIVDQVFHNNIEVPSEESLIEQVRTWLRQTYTIERNIITRKIEVDGVIMDDTVFNDLYCACRIIFEKANSEILQRIINSSAVPSYNPFLRFFEKHAHIRPTGQIERLFATIKTDTGLQGAEFFPDFAVHFGRKWMVGVISAIHGQHSPLMLVLAGSKQGTGKTEFFRRLLPRELQDYYAESKLDAGKDDEILMTQKLIIQDDEMGGKNKREEKKLKELLSKQTFSLREPYGRYNIDLQRLASLCGTTNENEILSDPTGNRRIIPIHVLDIDQPAYNLIDKTELVMEAYHLYHSGFRWDLDRDDIRILNQNTSFFEQSSAEFDLLMKYFELPKTDKDPWGDFKTATEIKSMLELRTGQKLNPNRLGIELKNAGFERIAKRIGPSIVRGYMVLVKGADVATLPAR